jgi:uncharacterized membrane protein
MTYSFLSNNNIQIYLFSPIKDKNKNGIVFHTVIIVILYFFCQKLTPIKKQNKTKAQNISRAKKIIREYVVMETGLGI